MGRGRDFDVALAHGSHELTIYRAPARHPELDDVRLRVRDAAASARLPRGDARSSCPTRSLPERLQPYGVRPPKLVQYPGLKEEYYLADFEPDRSLLDRFGVDPGARTRRPAAAADVSLYHRHSTRSSRRRSSTSGAPRTCTRSSCRAPRSSASTSAGSTLPSVILPEGAVDAQSLIALADLVVSAGGTMNREAAALGVPVYTTYGGRLGGVDEELIRDGRLKPLTDPRALDLRKRQPRPSRLRIRRDPAEMLQLLLSALDA